MSTQTLPHLAGHDPDHDLDHDLDHDPDRALDVGDAIAQASALLTRVAACSLSDYDAERCRRQLLTIATLANQVAELELRTLHQSEVVRAGQQAGAPSTATWLALQTCQTRKSTHARARLAAAVSANPVVREAMARGELLPEQARVILDEVAHLPGDRTSATERLVAEAGRRDAAGLRVEGRRALRAIQPAQDGEPAVTSPRPAEVVPHPTLVLDDIVPAEAPQSSGATGETPTVLVIDDDIDASRGWFAVPRPVARLLLDVLQDLLGPCAPPDPTPEQLGAVFCTFVERARSQSAAVAPVPQPLEPARPTLQAARARLTSCARRVVAGLGLRRRQTLSAG